MAFFDTTSSRARSGWLHLGICALLAVLSMEVTGFYYGANNNMFHVPTVLNLPQLEEFKGDAFYATLSKFISPVWPLIGLFANDSNIADVFLACAYLSRLLALVGIGWVLKVNGIGSTLALACCLGVVAATSLFTSTSPVGVHGMFIHYFSHTEVTWGLFFFSLGLMQRNRLAAAACAAGLALSVNAFVGVWLGFVNLFSKIYEERQWIGNRRFATYALVAGMVSLPVLVWAAVAVWGGDRGVPFSYLAYVREYFPRHFLIEAARPERLVALVNIFICGIVAAQYTLAFRYWVGVQLAVLALLAVGSVLPYLVDSRLVFNLHLLRADGLEQAVCVVLCALAGTRLVMDGGSTPKRVLGVLVLACLVTWPRPLGAMTLPVVALALWAGAPGMGSGLALGAILGRLQKREVLLAWVVGAAFMVVQAYGLAREGVGVGGLVRIVVTLAAVCFAVWGKQREGAGQLRLLVVCVAMALASAGLEIQRRMQWERDAVVDNDWNGMLAWVRTSDLHGPFLIPIELDGDTFRLKARRPVWVTWKEGAAVMWDPAFHAVWAPRDREVTALKMPEDFVRYAQGHAIPNILLDMPGAGCPLPAELIKQFGRYRVCRVDAAVGG